MEPGTWNVEPLPVDLNLLQEFERGLDPAHPEHSRLPARVLGYGEISTVFEVLVDGLRGLAFKRLPLFYNREELEQYQAVYVEYNRLLTQEVGLSIPPYGYAVVTGLSGRPVFYIVQRQLPAPSFAHQMMHQLPREEFRAMVQRILQEVRKVWDFNRRQDRVQIAIDEQIANWAIDGFDPQHPDFTGATLFYVDTSTPLFRVQGVEQLDTELFLRSAPSFLVWILRLLFLKDVVNRYYDAHLASVDMTANLYREQRPDLIPDCVRAVNEFLATEVADLGIRPISEEEVRAYYREDATIWSLYLSMRQIDRFLRTRLLRSEYPYILPGKIKR